MVLGAAAWGCVGERSGWGGYTRRKWRLDDALGGSVWESPGFGMKIDEMNVEDGGMVAIVLQEPIARS